MYFAGREHTLKGPPAECGETADGVAVVTVVLQRQQSERKVYHENTNTPGRPVSRAFEENRGGLRTGMQYTYIVVQEGNAYCTVINPRPSQDVSYHLI